MLTRFGIEPTLGIMLPVGFGVEPLDLLELAKASDRAGLDAIGVGELSSTEALSLMGAVAVTTERIRLETGVLSVASRAPSLLAMAASTLAALSDDRFVLGIGAGSPIVSSYHGDTFEHPLGRMAETLTAVRTALAGGRLGAWGGFKLRGIEPRSVPLFISAMNERMFELAAREADGVLINFIGPEQMAELAPELRRIRAEAGNDMPFEIIALVHAAAEDEGDPVSAYRREMAPYLAVPTYRRAAVAISSASEVDAAAEAWKKGGRDAGAAAFPQSIVDAALAVGEDQITRKVHKLVEAGCDGVRFVPVSVRGTDPAPMHALVDRLATMIAARTTTQENMP